MTEYLNVADKTLAYDLAGQGPLVVLAHGIGDSRHSFRFLAPALADAGYQIANVDIRGCGESSAGWDDYTRTDIGGDLVALIRHLGGPAVIIGHSISGGAATIAAATAPEEVAGVIELGPFTRRQRTDVGGLLRVKRFRAAYLQLAMVIVRGRVANWKKYLDVAYPTKPADWDQELARIESNLGERGRMEALQAMCKSDPSDAGAQLAHVACPVLVIVGSLDPDWAQPRAEAEKIVADLPGGIGEVALIEGAGHYAHAQNPDEVLAMALPFLAQNLTDA